MKRRHSETSRRPPTPASRQIEEFYAALPRGRANALHARDLALRLGINGRNGDRVLRNLAQHAREAHLLVCADDKGYFVPLTPDEAAPTIGRLESQSAVMRQDASQLRALVTETFFYQEKLL